MHEKDFIPATFPLYQAPASCGFPSPAADFAEDRLSLDQLLIQHPSATFFARATGTSMERAGIKEGAVLVVDRSQTPKSGDIIIAMLDGDLIVKRLIRDKNSLILQSEHPDYPPVTLNPQQELDIWGVIIAAVNQFRSLNPALKDGA
ncbi:translesion error-prone DNA polymerase V autoproteolytic subunit [Endozoicomonas sp. 4G]|uniref:LexA family protein n=1 Tax=Endozoicomonas sp. 4G TaxID=2872754 RepID=UPI002078AABC|nr:translesion error-prone DNA polymerase V autoproteolytic subunit [Endozoicomonas sp. 4G]